MSKAADLVKQLFGGIKETAQALAPGLKDIGPEIAAEGKRLGVQGSMELASALFGNGAFVPYGPGQYTPTPEKGQGQEQQQEHQQERGGMSR